MKYTKLIIICILLIAGCKKEPQDRKVEIIGSNCAYRYSFHGDGGPTDSDGGGAMAKENAVSTFMAYGGYKYRVDIIGDSTDFNCMIKIDGKNVYHHDGKNQLFEF